MYGLRLFTLNRHWVLGSTHQQVSIPLRHFLIHVSVYSLRRSSDRMQDPNLVVFRLTPQIWGSTFWKLICLVILDIFLQDVHRWASMNTGKWKRNEVRAMPLAPHLCRPGPPHLQIRLCPKARTSRTQGQGQWWCSFERDCEPTIFRIFDTEDDIFWHLASYIVRFPVKLLQHPRYLKNAPS